MKNASKQAHHTDVAKALHTVKPCKKATIDERGQK